MVTFVKPVLDIEMGERDALSIGISRMIHEVSKRDGCVEFKMRFELYSGKVRFGFKSSFPAHRRFYDRTTKLNIIKDRS